MGCRIKVSSYPDTVVVFDDRIRKDVNELYVEQRVRTAYATFTFICFSLVLFLSLWLLTDPKDRSLEVFKMLFVMNLMLFLIVVSNLIRLYLTKRMLYEVGEQNYRIEADVIDDMTANGKWLRDGNAGMFAELKLKEYTARTHRTFNLNRNQYIECYISDPAFLLYIGKSTTPVIAYFGAGFRL
jgi:hypothetical protein